MIVAYGNPFGANLRLFGLVFDNKRQLFINGDINKKYRPKSSSNSFLFPPKPSPMKLLKSSTIILITSFSSDFGHFWVHPYRPFVGCPAIFENSMPGSRLGNQILRYWCSPKSDLRCPRLTWVLIAGKIVAGNSISKFDFLSGKLPPWHGIFKNDRPSHEWARKVNLDPAGLLATGYSPIPQLILKCLVNYRYNSVAISVR